MITRCPECGTKFRISVDIIRAEDSTVRCGDCMAVFDARAQLVDEATESSYLADSAKERAARLRQQQQADLQQRDSAHNPIDSGAAGAGSGVADVHGANWVEPGWDSEGNRGLSPEAVAERFKSRPRGQLIIDRRESESDIDLDNADTIAYQPVGGDTYATEAPNRTDQHAQRSPDLEVAATQAVRNRSDHARASTDYGQRIDPLIDPDVTVSTDHAAAGAIDDTAIEFEKTLALENLTGIEPDYFEDDRARHSVIEKSVGSGARTARAQPVPAQSVTEAMTAGADHAGMQQGAYVGEHQFDTRAESRVPQTRLKTREDYSNDPDVVNRPLGPPRSERHLADYYRESQAGSADVANTDPYAAERRNSHDDYYAEDHTAGDSLDYSLDQSSPERVAPDRSQSATAMRQHVNERGVAIDSDDDYDEVTEAGSGVLGWLLVGLIAVLCAAAFYARDNIAKSELPQSVRAAFCSVAGCELPVATNIADLKLLRQKVYSHPSIDGALVVSIDLINNAVFPQPYPVLMVTMANSVGEAVAQRDFEPAAYLENYTGNETLAAGKPTRINIDIVDPGEDAQSFEMEFREQ